MTNAIYYRAHDVSAPSGGVGVLYEHVRVLRRAGFEACILHGTNGFVPSWLTPDVPIRYVGAGCRPDPDDFVVIPEDFSDAVRAFAAMPCRRIVFCQNQFYGAIAVNSIGDWRQYGIETALASSVKVREFLSLAGWENAPLIPCAIDLQRFALAPKILRIAYMPRKRPMDARVIAFTFPRHFPALADIPWLALDGLRHDQVAAALATSAIFLALGQHESLGLPALEAMAAGALVAGFHGDGDLALPDARGSALWANDVESAVDALGTLALWLKTDDPRGIRQRRAAAELVARYTPASRDAALLGFWREKMAG